MRLVARLALISLSAAALFAQTDRSTITGTVTDPAGAVVPSAGIEVRNPATGALFSGGTSGTGNYVVSVPSGTYELTVSVTGFKKYVRTGITVPVATTVRQDVSLEVGATSDTITVVDTTPIMKTDTAEISHVVTSDQANVLPVLTIGTGAGFGSIRNPLSVMSLLPGVQYAANSNLRVNGLPSNTGTIRVEGQDATNGLWRQQTGIAQQGVEAVQEVAVQTSDFAAEFGQAAGGYLNFTMKSGTNAYHGSAYDYFVNEMVNAGTPHTDAGLTNSLRAGQHVRNRQRRNDYGFTVGGPINIPKIYNGHDKSFFFFNWEQFRETQSVSNRLATVPTTGYRIGDFSTATPVCAATTTPAACPGGVGSPQLVLQNGAAARDQLGAVIRQNGIYDPATTFTAADGNPARTLFPNNLVPVTRMDPVALKIQAMMPLPNNANPFINNYSVPLFSNTKVTSNPSIKIDHNFSSTSKISGYVSRQLTSNPNGNGLDPVLTGVTRSNDRSTTARINYDHTLTPTLLFHVGIGYQYIYSPGQPIAFDQSTIGLKGFYSNTFPSFGGLNNAVTGGAGITIGAGTFGNQVQWDQKPTGNMSLTWVKNNHSFKFGGEFMTDGIINSTNARGNGIFGISADQTRNPWENGKAGLSGQSGFGYASFLLGQAQSLQTAPIGTMRLGNHSMGFYAQDTWKVTRKLTLNYGLRYDYQTYLKEQYGRMQSADFETVNTVVNRKGTVRYEGFGPGQCQCNFSHNYPLAFGPRLGVSYSINDKTVISGGAGLAYGTASNNSFLSLSILDFYTFNAPGFGANALNGGFVGGNPYAAGNPYGNPTLNFPDFNPNKYPTRGVCAGTANQTCYTPQSPFINIDDDSRPPRIFQYNFTIQREVMRNLVVDVSYVGNRGAWFTAPALNTTNYNALQPKNLANWGLDINNAADRALLTTPLGSGTTFNPTIAQRGFANLPYNGFPIGQNLVTAMVPRPQWGATIPPFLGPPLGRTWYDSIQIKVTKRNSHGLDMQGSFTYGKELSMGANSDTGYAGVPATTRINDVFNRNTNKQFSPLSQPFRAVISGTYTTPRMAATGTASKLVSAALRDWQIGAVMQYQSGALIQVPNSNNALFGQLNIGGGLFGGASTYYNFANGNQNLFLVDPNQIGKTIDPTGGLVLNKAAWVDAPAGQFATTAAYYNNYRWQRQPSENMNFGRNFRIREKMNLQIRAEFQNIFNRHFYGQPSSGNPNALTTNTNPNGALSAGFGFVNTLNGAGSSPRTGLLVARFTF